MGASLESEKLMIEYLRQTKFADIKLSQLLRPLAVIIPLAIAGNIIYILAASKPDIIRSLGNYNIIYLALALILVLIPWLAHAGRILLWSRAFTRKMTPGRALQTVMANDVGSAVTPTAIGGGYVKLAFLIKNGFLPGEATLVTLLGTFEDAAFFAIAVPLSILWTRAWNNAGVRIALDNLISYWPILIVAVVALLAIYAFFKKAGMRRAGRDISRDAEIKLGIVARFKVKLREFKNEFLAAFDFVMSKGKVTFGLCVLLAGFGWCCRYGAISALVVGLGYEADPVLLFLLQWIVFTTMTLVPSPGAVGGAEVSFAIVFNGIVPPGIVPLLTGAWRFLTFYLIVGLGAFYLMLVNMRSEQSRSDNAKITLPEEIKI